MLQSTPCDVASRDGCADARQAIDFWSDSIARCICFAKRELVAASVRRRGRLQHKVITAPARYGRCPDPTALAGNHGAVDSWTVPSRHHHEWLC